MQHEKIVIILLCGGDKSSLAKDVEMAYKLAKDLELQYANESQEL